MICPKCETGKLLVDTSHPHSSYLSTKIDTIRRYRKCDQCGHKVRTTETIADKDKPKQEKEN